MKTAVVFILLFAVSILTFLSLARAGNVVLPKFKESVLSYGVIKLDLKGDRKVTNNQLKNEEDDEDEDDDDENDDEEEG